MTRKTRKNIKATKEKSVKNNLKHMLKIRTCRAKMYKSVYGAASGGSIRSVRQLFY